MVKKWKFEVIVSAADNSKTDFSENCDDEWINVTENVLEEINF